VALDYHISQLSLKENKTFMSTLIEAIWHMLGVVCALLYWFLTIMFLWGGLTILQDSAGLGFSVLGLALGLFGARFFLIPKVLSSKLANILGCGIFIAFMVVVKALKLI
jgi:hypothetical protein